MCFFILNRYRVCKHDQIGGLAAFCTIAKALASPSGDKNIQFSLQEWCGVREGPSNLKSGGVIEPSYCGQLLFSPAYIRELGPESPSRGVCQKCGVASGQVRGNQFSQQPRRWYPQQTTVRSDNDRSSQPHAFGPESCLSRDSVYTEEREGCNIPRPLQPPSQHPLVGTQQLIRPTTHTPCDRKLPPDPPPWPQPPASSGNTGHPTNLSVALQYILYKYPPRTIVAIEKAIANQPPKQRTQTLQNLQASFESSQRIKEV